MIESEFPSLRRLWRCGFERPHNFDLHAHGKELAEWLMAASLPESLLKANAACRDAIHPAFPSGENFGHLRDIYKKRLAKLGEFDEVVWLASFGYLPVEGEVLKWGHPWMKLTGSRLLLDPEDRAMLSAFTLWRISVLSDLAEDRQAKIVTRRRRVTH
ncbi:MAG: hypothetical protein AB7G35_08775 [Hyphomicrobiaceae bacterium]